MPPRSILAAVDFSEPSRVALEFATRLANQCQATLHVLHVEDPLPAAAARVGHVDLLRETREGLARFTAGTAAAAGATAAAGSQSVRDAEPAWPRASSPWWGRQT